MTGDSKNARADDAALAADAAERPNVGADAQWRRTRAFDAPYVSIDGADPVVLKQGQIWTGSSGQGVEINYAATIQIQVRELRGQDLGLLNLASDDENALESAKSQAMSRKISEDRYWHGIDPQAARDPRHNPYFGSPAHLAWSEATSLRSGGRLDAEWLRNFDPYGGASGHGPKIAPDEMYPSAASKIAMAHKADWDLGRFFNAGPLESLYDSSAKQPQLGLYGLSYRSTVEPTPRDLYIADGHPDWKVDYAKNPVLLRSDVETIETAQAALLNAAVGIHAVGAAFDDLGNSQPSVDDGGNAKTTVGDTMPGTISRPRFEFDGIEQNPAQALYADRFASLMKGLEAQNVGLEKRKDNAAALLEATIAAKFKPDQDVQVLFGSKGNLIAVQGDGDAVNRVSVDIDTTDGAFERLSSSLMASLVATANAENLTAQAAQPQQTQPLAMQPDQPQEQRAKAPIV